MGHPEARPVGTPHKLHKLHKLRPYYIVRYNIPTVLGGILRSVLAKLAAPLAPLFLSTGTYLGNTSLQWHGYIHNIPIGFQQTATANRFNPKGSPRVAVNLFGKLSAAQRAIQPQ